MWCICDRREEGREQGREGAFCWIWKQNFTIVTLGNYCPHKPVGLQVVHGMGIGRPEGRGATVRLLP